MLKASYLRGFLLAVTMLTASTAYAQPIEIANGIGYTGSSGDVTYFVGVDFRLEILELFENWLGEEDPGQMTPIQMHPLRRALLDELAPWSDHQAVTTLKNLTEKYNYSLSKMILNAGDLPHLNNKEDWLKYINKPYQLRGHDPQEFNQDISAWIIDVNSFIEESGIIGFFEGHQNDYRDVARELYAAAEDGRVIDTVLGTLDFPNAELYFLASPMITPGRNYASYFHEKDATRLIGFYRLGPYKQIKQGMFRYPSWSHVPVIYDDTEQFIQLSIHEMTHMLLGDAIQKSVGEMSEEYVDLLAPLEAILGDSYGPLPDRAHTYIDELVTRAYTLEVIRKFAGEADFRQMVARELALTRGYAILMWKYLHETLAENPSGITIAELISGIPTVMSSWTENDLRPFSSYNEHSMTLGGFFREFITTFYSGNPGSFALAFDDELPRAWRDEFAGLLSERLGVPDDIQVLDDPGACPFVIKVRVDTPSEFSDQLWFSGLSMEDVEKMSRDAGTDLMLAPLVICKEPSESGVIDLTWHILSADVPPSAIVPYYFISVTHMLSIAGEPVAFESLTEETRQVTEWIVD